ncbi:MAG: magnesium transporter [Spirochaetales bacterium]|nr:magnesium transporter [Spirochaetales bacterium]
MERELHPVIPDELFTLIDEKQWPTLARRRQAWPDPVIVAPDIESLLGEMEKPDRVLFFRALPRELGIEVFALLSSEDQESLILDLTDRETRALLAEMSPDDRTAFLEELSGPITQKMLNMLSPGDLKEAKALLGYPEYSVGRLMSPDYLSVRPSWTLAECMVHFRKYGNESETMDVVYVTETTGLLVDALPLRIFVTGDPEVRVEDLMDRSYVKLSAYADQEEAVKLMTKYSRVALPVVDSTGILLGIVTVDDALEIAEEEATEDIQRLAGVSPLGGSYWDAGIWGLFKSRILWLVILVLVNLISSGVITAYEHLLSGYVVLAAFIPLLIGTGGNAGSQSATLMIRGISTGDIRLDQWGEVILKELVMGLLIGVTLGILGMSMGYLRAGFEVGLVVFLTLTSIITVTNLMGMILPFVLTKFKLDPAIASGPLVTTIADAAGLLIYFSFATLILL